jgi:hypothetical protein
MDSTTKENWQKIKTALELANKTDCLFYKRACSILAGGNDPINHESLEEIAQETD